MKMRLFALPLLMTALLISAAPARADNAIQEAQMAELDKLRAQVAGEIQLSAYDLLDEMVYGWTQSPIFSVPTPVVLAGITVPVGLGTGLVGLLENHLAALLIHNTNTRITLSHCPTCTAILVHSSPKGTVVSRGIDAPKTLAKAGGLSGGQHALFVDFEAEGSWLVMRARITKLSADLPVVWAKTLSTSGATPALLREGVKLKSAAEARQEYLDALAGKGVYTVPLRMSVHAYAGDASSGIGSIPYIWLQSGVEVGLTQARAWTGSFLIGYTWIPDAYEGWMAQARFSRLVSGSVRSLTQPDLFLFIGASMMTISGPASTFFRNDEIVAEDIMNSLVPGSAESRSNVGSWHVGMELRIKNRIGVTVFLEAMPTLSNSPNLGNYLDIGTTEFQGIGSEVTFCF
ncbi:hypothetical protein KAI87_02765 [Myxococcota bacterium]|nr:hypothetical protein [Myxococcota bacterium]